MPSRTSIANRLADLDRIKHKAVPEVPDLEQIIRDNLEVLAALIFAKMRGKSSVEEEAPGVLVVKNSQGSWKVVLKEDALSLTGFKNAPNLTQFIGKAVSGKSQPSEFWIKVAETAIKLIERSYEKETKPPVKFQSNQSPSDAEDRGNSPIGTLAPMAQEPNDFEDQISLDDSELSAPPNPDMGLSSIPSGAGPVGQQPPLGAPPAAPQTPAPPQTQPQTQPQVPVTQGTF